MRKYHEPGIEMGDVSPVCPVFSGVSRQAPQAASIPPCMEIGHAPGGGTLQALSRPLTIGPAHKPGTSFTLSLAYDSPQQELGPGPHFQHDGATGCQMKSDLSYYKQTKQNISQDVGLLFV